MDTLYLDFAITVKNNGSQTATNVKTTFPSLRTFGFYDLRADAPLRDTILSAGLLTDNYSTWFIPSLGVNQTATFTYRLVANKVYVQRKTLRTTASSDQFDGNIANNTAEFPLELYVAPCSGSVAGSLLVDYYLNQVTDASPIVIQNPNTPSGQYLTNGAIAYDFADQYIRRARGYLKPTETGAFKFYIAGDDNVDVYLSTDENPANKQRIAYVNGFTGLGEFNKFASQTSVSINLVAGRRYYLEIVNADKFGSDFFNLNWTTPSAPVRNSIPSELVESFCGDPIVVNFPDLTLQNLVVRDPSVLQGQNANLMVEAKNIGTANISNPISIIFYLSTDQTLDVNDIFRGSVSLNFLNSGQTISGIGGEINTTNIAAGNYYIIAKIDAENTTTESNENNNIIVSASPITIRPNVAALPDLTLENLRLGSLTFQQGQTLTGEVQINNGGLARASAFNVVFFLSRDNIASIEDLQGVYSTESFLDATTATNRIGSISIPSNFPIGQYYLILKVDPNNQIAESNEDNNTLIATNLITITAAPNTSTYCASKGIAPWEYAISNVTLNTLNNTSDKFKDFNTLGYSDYTNLTTTLNKGQSYPLSITPLFSWIGNLSNAYCRVWIDFNQNKTFEANELVLEKTNQNPLTQSITIPTTATLGNTRMRVSLKFGGYPTACEAFEKGEVEDYTIQINEETGGVITSNDIALSLTSTPSVFRQYTTQTFKISAKNTGNQVFTNVKIDFPYPTKTVNGGTATPSIGTWQEYCAGGTRCFTWTIPSLAANTTATLDVPLYVLDVVNSLTATTRLLSSNPVDNSMANNVATITINQQTGQTASPPSQALVQSKPTQLIPIVIQRINPTITENYIVIELESIVDKQIEFEIINSLGTVVFIEKIKVEKGNNKHPFDVSQLPKGLYFIQTSVGKGRNVPTKFVKF